MAIGWPFTLTQRGQTMGEQHKPYPARQAEVLELDDQLLAAAGCGCCEGLPALTHYSTGVDVEIFDLQSA